MQIYQRGSIEIEPQFVIVIGGPASGKTTEIRNSYSSGFVHFEPWEINKFVKQSIPEDEYTAKLVDAICDDVLIKSLAQKRNIVVELIGDKMEIMDPLIEMVLNKGYKPALIPILTDPVVSYERHLDAIEKDPEYMPAIHLEETLVAYLFKHLQN